MGGGCLILKRIITLKFWKGPEVLAQDRFKLIILNFKKYAFEYIFVFLTLG